MLDWAIEKGATHFCHWFQPLTGGTAEKHDAFIDIEKGKFVQKFSPSQLIQGEPDASSFPHGGSRSTFEARGYTSWDISSPIFINENVNGKTLFIPTAFVSYSGDALDIKTPLLRSLDRMNTEMKKFLSLSSLGPEEKSPRVNVTVGAEQEYFLIDKNYYYSRPDLIMSGKTLFGKLPAKNQQLEDNYFGQIPDRVLAFMQEVEFVLYRMGVPCKTRHSEVAPGQFELASVFKNANQSTDNNQLIMASLKRIAEKHDFICLLHEKPFVGVNGNGKHVNWSMATATGKNLLKPRKDTSENYRFLAIVAMVLAAVERHSDMIRMSIADRGNDHRLGANEAPPCVISVFIGETLEKTFEGLLLFDKIDNHKDLNVMDLRVESLAKLAKDNSDRNRTSPFAFTGDKFEFRAVGGSRNIGFPLTILNAAVVDIVKESNLFLEKKRKDGVDSSIALISLIKNLYKKSKRIVFNGDGYSDEWLKEAKKRKLSNLKTTADALDIFLQSKFNDFLINQKILNKKEISTRYNVLLERYNKHRHIEYQTLVFMVDRYVIPSIIEYKKQLLSNVSLSHKLELYASTEQKILSNVDKSLNKLMSLKTKLEKELKTWGQQGEREQSFHVVSVVQPLSESLAEVVNQLEEMTPIKFWPLPNYSAMLFVR